MFGTLILDCVKINTMYVLLIDVIGPDFENRRGGVEVQRSPRMREIGVRSLVATDLSRKSR